VLTELRAGRVEKRLLKLQPLIKLDADNPLYQTLFGRSPGRATGLFRAETAFRAALARNPDPAGDARLAKLTWRRRAPMMPGKSIRPS
jgi:predicted Zn-dependent protease